MAHIPGVACVHDTLGLWKSFLYYLGPSQLQASAIQMSPAGVFCILLNKEECREARKGSIVVWREAASDTSGVLHDCA